MFFDLHRSVLRSKGTNSNSLPFCGFAITSKRPFSVSLFSVSKPIKVDLAQWEARRSVYEEDSATRFFVFFANVSCHEDLRSTLE